MTSSWCEVSVPATYHSKRQSFSVYTSLSSVYPRSFRDANVNHIITNTCSYTAWWIFSKYIIILVALAVFVELKLLLHCKLLLCVTRMCFRTSLGFEQNRIHFADDILKCLFVKDNCCFLVNIPLNFVPLYAVNNMLALTEVMAWRRKKHGSFHETMLIRSIYIRTHHQASMS